MKYLVMTDIEGVTGVTTFAQAENSQLGRDKLMPRCSSTALSGCGHFCEIL